MYTAKKYDHLLGTSGFSDVLLKNHFTLYEGYVTNTNKLLDLLREKQPGTPEYAELHRRYGWEWNGMRLHELYFDNMKNGTKSECGDTLMTKITEQWGNMQNWEADFKGLGALRGIGWVLLVRDNETGSLVNIWVNEHDVGHLVGTTPLLVMDVFEHAFMVDYGLKRIDYLNAFWNAIDWERVESRFIGGNS